MAAAVNVLWAHISPALELQDVPEPFGFAAGIGPILRADQSIDLLTVDVFEDMFAWGAGKALTEG